MGWVEEEGISLGFTIACPPAGLSGISLGCTQCSRAPGLSQIKCLLLVSLMTWGWVTITILMQATILSGYRQHNSIITRLCVSISLKVSTPPILMSVSDWEHRKERRWPSFAQDYFSSLQLWSQQPYHWYLSRETQISTFLAHQSLKLAGSLFGAQMEKP